MAEETKDQKIGSELARSASSPHSLRAATDKNIQSPRSVRVDFKTTSCNGSADLRESGKQTAGADRTDTVERDH